METLTQIKDEYAQNKMYDDWYSFINSRDDLDDIMFEIGRFIIHIQQELQKHLADMFVLPQGTEHEYKFRITVE